MHFKATKHNFYVHDLLKYNICQINIIVCVECCYASATYMKLAVPPKIVKVLSKEN